VVHEDAKVVAEEGASDAEGPGGGNDESVAAGEEGVGSGLDVNGLEGRMGGLLVDGTVEKGVADEAEAEDCSGQGVAGSLGAAAEEVCEDLVVVLWRGVLDAKAARGRQSRANLGGRRCWRDG
jgi:hypothetical protein